MSEHTPGPLRAEWSITSQWWIVRDAQGCQVALVHADIGSHLAHTLAAAPEMLDALKSALEFGFGEPDFDNRMTGLVRKAIAKAEGK